MSFLDDLSDELAAHGVRGRTRARIVAEAEDHLRSDPTAQERFGSAREVANAFAAELGTQAVRRAAVGVFAALAVAGAVYAVCFVTLSFANPPTETFTSALGAIALAAMILAPQVAFVAGALALARAVRRRRERVLPTDELRVIRRRTTIALLSGLGDDGRTLPVRLRVPRDARPLVALADLLDDDRRRRGARARGAAGAERGTRASADRG